ncbi:hypothetical protein K438DRAFT_1637028, partial [Mycena galopus ATCC 62051]
MVTVFLEEVLCWQSPEPGLYGHTNVFYGTVEQQGRLTLHLHMLLWVLNALSPQAIRDKIMSQDSEFQKRLVAYLESAHQGDFLNGTMQEVKARKGFALHPTPTEVDQQNTAVYKVPTLTLPQVPPPICQDVHQDATCGKCTALSDWYAQYEHDIDDLWLRCNVHTCQESVQDAVTESKKKDWRKLSPQKQSQSKGYWERRGCMTKKGICKARFPRDTFEATVFDTDGHINLKKNEPYINTMSQVVTYFSRSNTDVT